MPSARTLFDTAWQHQQQGDVSEAIAHYKKAIAKKRDYGDAHYMLGTLLAQLGKLDDAINHLEKAVKSLPKSAMARCNLGLTLKLANKPVQAEKLFREALKRDPELCEALNNLAALLIKKGHPCEAEKFARRCIGVNNQQQYAKVQLANALADQGKIEEAIDWLEPLIQRATGQSVAESNYLTFCHYSDQLTASQITARHRAWAGQFGNPKTRPPHKDHSRLRIGYLSADFSNHPVGRLIEPIIEHHDTNRFDLFLYHDSASADEVTARLQQHAGHWAPVSDLADTDLCAQIRSDQIDILVELSGHSARNRLTVMAERCAPIQMTYLGYPGTTGLSAIDYAISDVQLDPSDADQEYYSEQLLRLTRPSFCFRPLTDAPGISPSTDTGFTFGSFNTCRKLTPAILEAWAEILTQVPGSRLLMQARGLDEPARIRQLHGIMAANGIPAERISTHGFVSLREHLELIGNCDLCLDSWPWSGHMTTLNTLWQGVPVLTLAGKRRSGRMSAAILSELELPWLIADTRDNYVNKAVDLASKPQPLASLRPQLRERLQASALFDYAGLARSLENLYQETYQQQCQR